MATKEEELHDELMQMNTGAETFRLDIVGVLLKLNDRIGTLEVEIKRLRLRRDDISAL